MRFVLIFLMLMLSTSAYAQSSSDIEALTKKEEAAREKAKALESERSKVRKDVDTLKKSLAKTAKQTLSIEANLTTLERETESLADQTQSLIFQIEKDRAQYSNLLAALQRLEATPPPSLALTPSNAKRAASAGLLMTTLSDQLRQRAAVLKLNLKALEVSQAQLALKKTDLSDTKSRLAVEMKNMNQGLSSKSDLEAKLSEEKKLAAAEADRLAAESKSLLDLIAKLEKEAAKVVPRPKPGRRAAPKLTLPKGTKRFAEAKGTMIRPISGRILKKYGRGEKGVTFSGRSSGNVVAPYTGRVEFSGPFKNYDKVLILNVGDNYFVLLTGLEELFVDSGDTVRRGEPVGKLPSGSGTELYIELRRNGSAIDPSPWFAPSDVKSG
jgi:septal ring factor EnvC (AmiA/AmiB activator)